MMMNKNTKNKKLIMLFYMILIFIICGCSAKPADDIEKQIFDSIEGHWCYNEPDELMNHLSEDIYFYEDGSFSSSTWREKCEGEYQIDGNKIIVKYDFYFNPAGSKQYFYQYSGTKTFESGNEKIRLIKDQMTDDVYQYDKIFTKNENTTDLKDVVKTDVYRMYTSDETWNTIEISGRTEKGFYLEASCCNSSLNLGEFKGYFEYATSDVAVFSGKNYEGIEYKITAEFKGDSLLVTVDSNKEAEYVILGFGKNVYLSGGYLRQ